MITPFGSKEAYKLVKKIAGTSKSKVIHNLENYLNDLNEVVYRQRRDFIKIDDAYVVWAYACIFDDIGNGNDYSLCCIHNGASYAEKYIEARENIRIEFNKTKLISKNHIYSMPDILCKLLIRLYNVRGECADSELFECMKRIGLEKEFKKDSGRLVRNLRKYIINLRETYSKEFGDDV